MGTLPFNRIKTLQPGQIVEHDLVDGIQDGIIRNGRTHFVKPLVDGTISAFGALSFIGAVPQSSANGDGFHAGMPEFPIDTGMQIGTVRMRVDQTGANDTCLLALWEVDDTLNAPGVSVASASSSGVGPQWVTLANVNRPLLSAYSWYIRVDHTFVSGQVIRYGPLEVRLVSV